MDNAAQQTAPYSRCGRRGCGGCCVVRASRKLSGTSHVDYLYCWKCGWRPEVNKTLRHGPRRTFARKE